ncbi:acyl-CoA N-acyltransferase [Tothia fuscella]|uniref:Acyl-CoA N-acyltransferase n=1 Tax=Tothia fuscella TaxID=1048955 RepID=A0A9P4TU49_9PEZI|nr:acyl-CoA N-acyltransferase [Tothia fuscella]
MGSCGSTLRKSHHRKHAGRKSSSSNTGRGGYIHRIDYLYGFDDITGDLAKGAAIHHQREAHFRQTHSAMAAEGMPFNELKRRQGLVGNYPKLKTHLAAGGSWDTLGGEWRGQQWRATLEESGIGHLGFVQGKDGMTPALARAQRAAGIPRKKVARFADCRAIEVIRSAANLSHNTQEKTAIVIGIDEASIQPYSAGEIVYSELVLLHNKAPITIMNEADIEAKFGIKIDDLEPAPSPDHTLQGNLVTLIHLQASHAEDLYAEIGNDDNIWSYMPFGPFKTLEEFKSHISEIMQLPNSRIYAIINNSTTKPVGYIGIVNMVPSSRVCEIGFAFSPGKLQRTRAATEAFYLILKEAFGHLRSRRVEWKCNALNEASQRAAVRLGFQFEGVFRNHMILKGRSRDSHWYSMLDEEWPPAQRAFEMWLDDENFDVHVVQIRSLATFRSATPKD